MAPPTTTPPPGPSPAPWDGTIHWLTSAFHNVVDWITWAFTVQHLAEAAVIGAPLLALLTMLRLWHIHRLLARRRAYAIIPTARHAKMSEDAVDMVGRGLGQLRRRALLLRWWLRPASAFRIRLDTTNYGGTIYSLDGPPWMREQVETASFMGLILCPMDALDLGQLTPKGLYIPPEEPFDFDAQTQPDAWPVPAGR